MSRAAYAILVLTFLVVTLSYAGDKRGETVPFYVLQAKTVAVILSPDSSVSLTNPGDNRTAREDVEKALAKWGRFTVQSDTQTADLIIVVQKGRTVTPAVRAGDPNDRPVVLQLGEGQTRVGIQRGTPPDLQHGGIWDSPGGPDDTRPRPTTEISSGEDNFTVYRGQVQYPLDSPPAWRYTAKDALRAPSVPAVAKFRKAIEDAEKKQGKKP